MDENKSMADGVVIIIVVEKVPRVAAGEKNIVY